MRRWNNLTEFCITSTAESALNKLKKYNIPVKNCKKSQAQFIFCVKNDYRKKVFAIFASPCYNIIIKRESALNRALRFAVLRAGLIVGVLLFIASAAISNAFVLKITVSGSGAYMSPAVKQIVYSCGFKEYALYSKGDAALVSARVMALPNVTFCSISKSGSVLYIDVQTNGEEGKTASGGYLCSDVCGTVNKIVALCGTALVAEGDEVAKGTPLIAAYSVVNGENYPCLAAGYADIICSAQIVYGADCQSDENLRLALASCLSVAEQILTRDYSVKSTADGVNYIINFTYMHTISINLR